MKIILQIILNFLARSVLRRYQPEIIGVTGSVGKTSTKEAIYTVLSGRFNVRRNVGNYNNELGVPLTVLGCESGGRSLWKWLKVFGVWCRLIFGCDKNYPEILVLEMGADHPGDIRYLTDLAPCKVGVITAIGPTHVEFFKTLRKIVQEKQIIITHLKRDNFAILNADDELVSPLRNRTEAEVTTFGFSEKADLQAVEFKVDQENVDGVLQTRGTRFKIKNGGSLVPVFLPGVAGKQHIYAALVGAAAGLIYGLNLLEIAERLRLYNGPPSRMRILDGIKYSILIDDTYNSSPVAAMAALEVLDGLEVMEGGHKIAVLGDMLELGALTEEMHQQVGKRASELKLGWLVTVGERAKIMAAAAKEKGMANERIVSFGNSTDSIEWLKNKVEAGDLVLLKGSRGVRMEKIVLTLLADPTEADKVVGH